MANQAIPANVGLVLITGLVALVVSYLISENVIIAIVAALIGAYIASGIRIIRPTHRVLIEWLGKYQKFGQPGFYWIISGIQNMYPINITEKMINAERQEVITGDNLNVSVDAQVYFKVKEDENNVKLSQYNVFNYEMQIVQLARTTLRNIMGNLTLKEANSKRGEINSQLQDTLRTETQNWGIDIIRTELKEIQPPPDVQDAMNQIVVADNKKVAAKDFATAKETEADGFKRAEIKTAEGNRQAAILRAEGQAEAIKLVNEAAQKYFEGNAKVLKQLEVAQASFEKNTKIIVPSDQNIVNVLGNLTGVDQQ
jgi:regulator of protease activity HflC (stomatin/prohibitin superfamily)